MNAKTVGTIILLLFVAASVVYLIVDETASPQGAGDGGNTPTPAAITKTPEPGEGASSATAPDEHVVIAYYFHLTKRCITCLAIESLSEEALREAFPDAFDEGRLEWHAINMEEDGNTHYATDYNLVTSSLVLVDMRGGKQHQWIHMEKTWQLVDDEVAIKAYVADQARKYLEPAS